MVPLFITPLLKNRYLWIGLYIAFVVFSFFYVKSVLKAGKIDISTKEEQKVVADVKPAKVTFNVENFGNVTSYSARLQNTDTVSDLLNYLRKNNNFTYNKVAYIDGFEITDVNGVAPQPNYKWSIFLEGADITATFDKAYLHDNRVYSLRQIPKTN